MTIPRVSELDRPTETEHGELIAYARSLLNHHEGLDRFINDGKLPYNLEVGGCHTRVFVGGYHRQAVGLEREDETYVGLRWSEVRRELRKGVDGQLAFSGAV